MIQNFYKETSWKAPTLKALKEGKDNTKINCMEISSKEVNWNQMVLLSKYQ